MQNYSAGNFKNNNKTKMNKMNKLMNRKKSYQHLDVRKFAYKSKEN